MLLREFHSTEQTPFTRVLPPGTHLTAESTGAKRNKRLAQGHNILMQAGGEQSVTVSTTRHLTDMANVLRQCCFEH